MNLCNFCKLHHIDSGVIGRHTRITCIWRFLFSRCDVLRHAHLSLRRHIPAALPIPQKNCNHIRSALPADPRRLHQSRKWKRKLIRVNPPSFEISFSLSKCSTGRASDLYWGITGFDPSPGNWLSLPKISVTWISPSKHISKRKL